MSKRKKKIHNGLLAQLQDPVEVKVIPFTGWGTRQDLINAYEACMTMIPNPKILTYNGPALKMLFVGSEEDYNKLSQEMKDRFEPYGTRW